MSEFHNDSRTSSALYPRLIFQPYHENFVTINTRSKPFRQPQAYYTTNMWSQPFRQHQPYVYKTMCLSGKVCSKKDHRNRSRLCLINSSSSTTQFIPWHQSQNEAKCVCWSPPPMAYQININALYMYPHMQYMNIYNGQILNGGNTPFDFMHIPNTPNNLLKLDNKVENECTKKVKHIFNKFSSAVVKLVVKVTPVGTAICSFLSRTTDVATDVVFTTNMCSSTGTCDCVWTERGSYGWPGWDGYAWGPTACWQTCNNYHTIEKYVTNDTSVYPTHHCFAQVDESRCSTSLSSSGLVHPLWCSSAIIFIVLPLLVTNCVYMYKARLLHFFKKNTALLTLFTVVPIFHFIWPLNHILQPIMGECANYCLDITITTRIVGAIFESVPQFCLQNFVMMQAAFGDVVGIDNPFSAMAFLSVFCSLCSIAYAVSSFMGEDRKDKMIKFVITFFTIGVRVTVNSMYGRHSFGLFMYILPMTSAFIFICICNFLHGVFFCKYSNQHSRGHRFEINRNDGNASLNNHTVDKNIENINSFKKKIENNYNMLQDMGCTSGMFIVSASCDGFSVNGLLASIAFLPWVIWPFVDNLSVGMPQPGFTISVLVLSIACVGIVLNIILVCRRYITK